MMAAMPMKPRPFSPQRHGCILLKGHREFKGAGHPVVGGRPCRHRFPQLMALDER